MHHDLQLCQSKKREMTYHCMYSICKITSKTQHNIALYKTLQKDDCYYPPLNYMQKKQALEYNI